MSEKNHLQKRHRKAQRFKYYGMAAVGISALLLALLIGSVLLPGLRGFVQPQIKVTLEQGELLTLQNVQKSMLAELNPDADRPTRRAIFSLMTSAVVIMAKEDGSEKQVYWIPASDKAARYLKDDVDLKLPEHARGITDQQIEWRVQLVLVLEALLDALAQRMAA